MRQSKVRKQQKKKIAMENKIRKINERRKRQGKPERTMPKGY